MKIRYEQRLEKGRVLVYGISKNVDIKKRIKNIYNEKRIAQGIKLYEQAKKAFETQQTELIESKTAVAKFDVVRGSIHQSLVNVRRAGRYFFKNDIELSTLLRLNKEIPKAYAEWKILAEETLNVIQSHGAIQAKLTLIDISPRQIVQVKNELLAIDQLKLNAEQEDGEAQQASVNKKELFDQFMAYCSDLRECLNLFYEGNARQKLEEVGIVVK